MSDHTDDDSPRERYEGPMATKANGNSLKNSKSSVGHEAAGKAETMMCAGCWGSGEGNHGTRCPTCNGSGVEPTGEVKAEPVTCDECFGRYKPETCPKCSGTGLRTTGEVAGSDKADEEDSDDIFIHPVPPKSVSRPFVAAERVDELEATIAEQSAEIERLKEAVETIEVGRERDHEKHLLAEAEASSWILQQNNKIAALEAERDELAGRLATQQEFIDDYRKARDLREDAADQLLRERNAANARAEKYLRVIAAQNAAIAARIQCHETEIDAAIAASEAGLSLARDPKEPTHE